MKFREREKFFSWTFSFNHLAKDQRKENLKLNFWIINWIIINHRIKNEREILWLCGNFPRPSDKKNFLILLISTLAKKTFLLFFCSVRNLTSSVSQLENLILKLNGRIIKINVVNMRYHDNKTIKELKNLLSLYHSFGSRACYNSYCVYNTLHNPSEGKKNILNTPRDNYCHSQNHVVLPPFLRKFYIFLFKIYDTKFFPFLTENFSFI